MARQAPGNAAFPNATIAPNVVKNGFGVSINSHEYPRPLYMLADPQYDGGGTGLMHQAKALVIVLDQEENKKIKTIDYSIYLARIGSQPEAFAMRVFGRLMVIRNFVGDARKLIFDPILTDNTPFLNASVGADIGINWGPMYDWTKADIVYDRWINLEGPANIILEREYQANETIHVVLTPFYNPSVLEIFQQNSSIAPIRGPGEYAGAESASTPDQKITTILRTLSVGGKYC